MLLIFIITFIILFFFYVKLKYFTLRGPIPGIPPQFLFGNLMQIGMLRGDPLPDIYKNLKKRFGEYYQLWFGPWRFIVIGNITDVQHIFTHRNIYDQGDMFSEQFSVVFPDGLVCLRGAKYKRHATVILPLFRRSRIMSNFNVIVDCTDKLLDNWRNKSRDHIHTDIIQQSKDLLLEIFGMIAFDYDLQILNSSNEKKQNNELSQALNNMLSVFDVILYIPRSLSIIYLKLNLWYRRARKTIEKYLDQMIEKELNEDSKSRIERKRTSLIASLVHSLQEDENIEAMKNEEDKKGLSRSEVMNEILLFLVAGYETTSTTLSWFIHLMSKHPLVQRKIKAEIRENLAGRDLTVDHIDSLFYLDCVIDEVMRFAPAAPFSVRTLIADDCLPNSGIQLYKGEQVITPYLNLFNDPQLWSYDPEVFYPERFLNQDKNHNPYAFIPFGSGHRPCAGQDLARFELKVMAARLMQHVTIIDGGSDINAGGYLLKLTMIPKKIGVKIQFDQDE